MEGVDDDVAGDMAVAVHVQAEAGMAIEVGDESFLCVKSDCHISLGWSAWKRM